MKRTILLVLPITIAIAGLVASFLIARGLDSGKLPAFDFSSDRQINFSWNLQLMTFAGSFVALGLAFALNKKNARMFFKFSFRGDKANDDEWKIFGPLLAVGLTFGTTMMMSMGVASQGGELGSGFFKLLPLVVLFAFTNAWTEEMVSRFVIVAGLYGKISPTAICWISGSIFGLAHIWGTPSGLFGVLATGVVGGLWAKSVIDTKSMGWALLIHFLQDVVIFGAGAMVIARKQ